MNLKNDSKSSALALLSFAFVSHEIRNECDLNEGKR